MGRGGFRPILDPAMSLCFPPRVNPVPWLCIALGVLLGAACPAATDFSWAPGAGFRTARLTSTPGPAGKAGFTLMSPADTGIRFTNTLRGDAFLTNGVAHNGSGVAIGDVDGDGWADVYLCNLQGPNRLYRNLGGWRFEEMELREAACPGQMSTGAVLADVDGDGDLDLLVNGIGRGTRLFLNDGRGRWTEKRDSGLSTTASPMSMALADIDGDGDLDLYCAHYIDIILLADPSTRLTLGTEAGHSVVTAVNGVPVEGTPWKNRFQVMSDGDVRELPQVDGLYRNDGNGHFTDIASEPGVFQDSEGRPIAPFRDWGLGVMFRDINGDGAPDLFVSNDNASPCRFWLNTGRGTFRLMEPLAFRHLSRSSMGLDFADVNRDGLDDFLVLDMLAREHGKRMTQLVRSVPDPTLRERVMERPLYNRNVLFLGQTDGFFTEVALWAGVAASDWSWCPMFLDVDLDGYEDLLVTNGFEQDVMDQDSTEGVGRRRWTLDEMRRYRGVHPAWRTPNASFRNRGDGSFEPMREAWGFDLAGVSQGMAAADLDHDGDLDLVVNNLNAGASLYRNDAVAPRIAVRLRGTAPNTAGVGARIRLLGGKVTQSQEMIAGGRYLSGDDAARVFAAGGAASGASRLEVQWRSGRRSLLTNLEPDRIYEVDERGAVAPEPVPRPASESPYFADLSSWLDHAHVENDFFDPSRQPLLPLRLSRLGPGVASYDFNSDGWEDLIVTAARGGKLAVFANEDGKRFVRLESAERAPADQGAVVGWADGRGNRNFLVALSNYELASTEQSRIELHSPVAAPELLPAGYAALGPLAVSDIDGDGDMDLFVGGRVQPGRYPEAVSSTVWINDQGRLRPDPALSKPFEAVGLVSGATFGDLDGDGQPDLALAVEWGPVRVFRNQHGRFEEMTQPWGLAARTGWWTGIACGDFDGDGRMDLAVGNRGRNTSYELYQPGPFRLYYVEGSAPETLDLVEAWRREETWLPVRNRLWFAPVWPELAERFPTHEAYGRTSVEELLGGRMAHARWVEGNTAESGVFLNRGSRFDWIAFPSQAQWAPVESLSVGDFDGDGVEDVFLSQNFFGIVSELSREDGGRGLWLRGGGDGRFAAVDARTSGIRIYGEQRGAALADFNHDGRVDLAVSQNNGPTRLFVNQRARPGLRVTLTGSSGNPDAVGAQLRVVYAGDRRGPCRAIQAGSGYGSQEGATQVLGLAAAPTALWIRWPGGRIQTVPVADPDREVRVTFR
jgi:hypothetical protein